jgi:anti-sigma factor RsiW
MTLCRDLDVYLDRRLNDSTAAAFAQHLRGCEACQAEVTAWRQVEGELKDWARAQGPSAASLQSAAERLVRRARRARGEGSSGSGVSGSRRRQPPSSPSSSPGRSGWNRRSHSR